MLLENHVNKFKLCLIRKMYTYNTWVVIYTVQASPSPSQEIHVAIGKSRPSRSGWKEIMITILL